MRLILIAAALALSGCVATEQSTGTSRAGIPESSANEAPNDGTTQSAARPSSDNAKAHQPLSKIRLIGQDKKGLRQLLGVPNFKRHDPPAELWRYRDQSCLLDFYLYPPKKGKADAPMKVSFVEARTPQGPSTPVGNCLKTLHGKFIARKTS